MHSDTARLPTLLYDPCGIASFGWVIGLYALYGTFTTGQHTKYAFLFVLSVLVVSTAQATMHRLEDAHPELEDRWTYTITYTRSS